MTTKNQTHFTCIVDLKIMNRSIELTHPGGGNSKIFLGEGQHAAVYTSSLDEYLHLIIYTKED